MGNKYSLIIHTDVTNAVTLKTLFILNKIRKRM